MSGGRKRPGRVRAGALAALTAAGLAGCSVLPDVGEPQRRIEAVAVDQAAARRVVSAYRATHGLPELALDPDLGRVAQRQADAMARADRLSHEVAGKLPDRLAALDVKRGAMAENVSAGYAGVERAVAGWERSPAHNANLLFKPLRRMGIAAASAPGTRYGTFWALVMTD